MRSKFFLYLGLALLGLIAVYFIWLVLKSFYSIIDDARTSRELDRLADQLAEKRRQQREKAHARLNNGCEHVFHDALGALPPDVCRKCGIAREMPEGDCDHRWIVSPGIVPESQCQQCGQRYSRVPAADDLRGVQP